jgi:hypothetical protein
MGRSSVIPGLPSANCQYFLMFLLMSCNFFLILFFSVDVVHLCCLMMLWRGPGVSSEFVLQSRSHITTDSQSTRRLGVRRPSGDGDQFFFLLEFLYSVLLFITVVGGGFLATDPEARVRFPTLPEKK